MLRFQGFIDIPPHIPSEFDHGDVHVASGQVFVAHTATDTVEILDSLGMKHLATIGGCAEGSGVLCAQEQGLIFAAARGAGKILVIEATSKTVLHQTLVGPRPNGLAWDTEHGHLLIADVKENTAHLINPSVGAAGSVLAIQALPGRPRWATYDRRAQRFLVNIREPACVVALAAETAAEEARWPVSIAGPHGMDLDPNGGRIFVACDGGAVVTLDLATGRELATVTIEGPPDAIWYNARRERLYVAIAEPGVVDVVDTSTMTITQHVITEADAHTTAYDEVRQRLYVFLPRTCRAAVYEEV